MATVSARDFSASSRKLARERKRGMKGGGEEEKRKPLPSLIRSLLDYSLFSIYFCLGFSRNIKLHRKRQEIWVQD